MMTLPDTERRSVWVEILQVLLSATGIFAVAFYAVGWLYWIGYFGYFEVPLGAVDLDLLDVALGGFPRFLPVIGTLALFPLVIFFERSLLRRTARSRADAEALNTLAEDLRKRSEEAEAVEDQEEAQKLKRELEALWGFYTEVRTSMPLRWVPALLLKANWIVLVILVIGSLVGSVFLISYLEDGLKSAAVAPIRVGLAGILGMVAITLAYHVWERRFTAITALLAVILMVCIPVSAWVDGRASAFAAWNSNDRTNHFGQVVLYSDTQLFDEWERTEGELFASPELLLIRKAGDTYVVASDDSSDKVTVISSDVITHVDYFR